MNRMGFKGRENHRGKHDFLHAILRRQSRSLFIRTMTVGPGITPGLLTLLPSTAEGSEGFKRSRAMHIACNYRRWGVAPRPENVAASKLAAVSFYHIFLKAA